MKNNDSSYLVVFDPAEAERMAKEALELWLEEIGSENSSPRIIVEQISTFAT